MRVAPALLLTFALTFAACAPEPSAPPPSSPSSPGAPLSPSLPSPSPSASPTPRAVPSASATTARAAAAPVASAAPAVREIRAAGDATCALLVDGTVRCWGDRAFLGNAPMMHREGLRPTPVPMSAPASHLVLSDAHACVLHPDATMSCWGSNYAGELGLGAPTQAPGPSVETPTLVPGVHGVTQIDVGSHTIALLADKTVMFWGDYDPGNGDPRPAGSATPAPVVGLRNVEEIADMSMGACARLGNGTVKCWYMVSPGLIPRGKDRVDPVVAPVRGAVSLHPNGGSMCAKTTTGKLTCWATLSQTPVEPRAAFANASDLAELAFSSGEGCARRLDGQVLCEDDKGKLRPVPGLGAATQLTAGGSHFCALAQGKVLCWGANGNGQLGDGTTVTRDKPVAVVW